MQPAGLDKRHKKGSSYVHTFIEKLCNENRADAIQDDTLESVHMISVAPFRQDVSRRRALAFSKQAESEYALLGFLGKGGPSYLSFLDFN
jgi:hypothetical protein